MELYDPMDPQLYLSPDARKRMAQRVAPQAMPPGYTTPQGLVENPALPEQINRMDKIIGNSQDKMLFNFIQRAYGHLPPEQRIEMLRDIMQRKLMDQYEGLGQPRGRPQMDKGA